MRQNIINPSPWEGRPPKGGGEGIPRTTLTQATSHAPLCHPCPKIRSRRRLDRMRHIAPPGEQSGDGNILVNFIPVNAAPT